MKFSFRIIITSVLLFSASSAYAQDYARDLSINPTGVQVSGSAIAGRSIRIYTTVQNNSKQDLFGVVKFYDEKAGAFIGEDQPVSVLAGKTDDVFTDWKVRSVGNYPISVRVIPWDEAGDDPSNNKVTKSIVIDVDTDEDGTPNYLDPDDDNDGTPDKQDSFSVDAAESADTDADGIGNNADTDDDNDGLSDIADLFPLDAKESSDKDADGVGDNSDPFPTDANESKDSDSDGVGDNSDANNSNHGPVAQIETKNTMVNAGTIITLSALKSNDPDGEIVSYDWDFGDGSAKQQGVVAEHIYDNAGQYTVQLTVKDNSDEIRTETIRMSVIYKWQTIALSIVTILLFLLLFWPWFMNRKRYNMDKEFEEEVHHITKTTKVAEKKGKMTPKKGAGGAVKKRLPQKRK